MTRLSEDGLIARYFGPLAGPGALGLADDAALFTPEPGHDLVLTVDGVVAGVHFLPDDPPASIARKALGVNLSDLAAKGAVPVGFLLTLALPDSWEEAWLAAFSAGLAEAAAEAGCSLLGGDTVRAGGPLSLSITAFGQVPSGRMVHRTTAKAGDRICVTGTIGDAVLGLALRTGTDEGWGACLGGAQRDHLVDRYLHPRPRLTVAAALRSHASAAMDVSDGLVGDLSKMLRVSGVSAEVALDAVPFSEAARAALAVQPDLRAHLVIGGDDYEILACVPERSLSEFLRDAGRAGVAAAVIGKVVEGETPPIFRDGKSRVDFARGSFSHF